MPAGPQTSTIQKGLAALGAKNQKLEEKKPADLLAAWAKDSHEAASNLWRLVENDQVKFLAGASAESDLSAKPLYKHCSCWDKIQVADKKAACVKHVGTDVVRQLLKADKAALDKLFVIMTCMDPNRPIAKHMTHGEVADEIDARIKACGNRHESLQVANWKVDWDSMGPWKMKSESGAVELVHAFHNVSVKVPEDADGNPYVLVRAWAERAAKLDNGVKEITCRKLFKASLFDYSSKELHARKAKTPPAIHDVSEASAKALMPPSQPASSSQASVALAAAPPPQPLPAPAGVDPQAGSEANGVQDAALEAAPEEVMGDGQALKKRRTIDELE